MKQLSTYLSDHLAGSTGALEMLEDMIDAHKGESLEPFLKELHADIKADQDELQRLMRQLEIGESSVKNAGAWIAEKFSRAKLRIGDNSRPNLRLLESFESLSLGITGKRSLWRMLTASSTKTTRLNGSNFARLEKRAVDQFERVDKKAIATAAEIFPAELNGDPTE